MDKKIIIAIDGYSSCGKSTMAKALAKAIGYIYVDTGAMYRGIGLAALQHGLVSETGIDSAGLERLLPELCLDFRLGADGLPELYLNGVCVEQHIRSMEVSSLASKVSALPAVREAMTAQQRRMGEARGIVMDGRDIGTVVFPQAELKVFVTARPEVRAERRFLELRAKGDETLTFDEVLRGINERDYADTHRAIAPLRQAEDAQVLDNSELTREEQMQRLLEMYRAAITK